MYVQEDYKKDAKLPPHMLLYWWLQSCCRVRCITALLCLPACEVAEGEMPACCI
jgi:hypothetical protein